MSAQQLNIFRRLWPADWREKNEFYTAAIGTHFELRSRFLTSGEWMVSVYLTSKSDHVEITADWDPKLATVLGRVHEYLGALSADLRVGLPDLNLCRDKELFNEVVAALRLHLGNWVETTDEGSNYTTLCHGQFYIYAGARDHGNTRLELRCTGADAALGIVFVDTANEVGGALVTLFAGVPPRPHGL